VDEWLRLPGISIHQAHNLVELIGMGIQFLSIQDLAAALSLPIQRFKPLEKILSFAYYDPESLLTPQRFNINTAQLEELLNIPILDISLAEQILGDRQEKGRFQNLADFKRRLNLGSELTSDLMYYLQF
jgi:DNA uptake protein ComE-like DNA-binding protein